MKRKIPYYLLIRDNFHQLVMSNSLLGMVFACSVVSQHFPTIREIVLVHLYVYLKLSLYITDVDIKVYLHHWIGQTMTLIQEQNITFLLFSFGRFLPEKNVWVIARNSWTVFGLCVMDCELYLKDDTWCKGMVDVLVMAKMSVMDVAVAQHQFRIELWLTCVPMVN